mmetsp:Transcript_10805/g.24704  ORF Transcript_10805/g.24704 Transcript_10805/m.24704 type:complete len:208 (-) Transcript_10805:48-671(-)
MDTPGDQPPPMNKVVSEVLTSFQDPKFQLQVEEFVNINIDLFARPCVDGSQPIEWQLAHRKYREIFEQKLQKSIGECGADVPGFMEYFEQCVQYYRNDPYLNSIIDSLTRSESYEAFLQDMFAAVRENWVPDPDQAPSEPAAAADSAAPVSQVQLHQVSVQIPEGYGPGMLVLVDYLGFQHQVPIPDGYAPGMIMPCTLQVPALSSG